LNDDDFIAAWYISGPMRLIGPPDFNHDQFCEVEQVIRDTEPDATVYNPARNFDGDKTLDVATYMTLDIQQVLMSEAIVFLPRWEESEGAVLEARVGLITDKRFFQAYKSGIAGNWIFDEIDADMVRDGIAEYEAGRLVDFDAAIVAPGQSADFGTHTFSDWTHLGTTCDWNITLDTSALKLPEESPRASALNEARDLITGDRNNSYGPPTQDFQRSADALNAYGYRGPDGRDLAAHDVAIMVMAVKLSRLMWTPSKRDSWVDLAGYAACGYECSVTEASDDASTRS
jgi:uncharacterized protein DUF6378/uncharacterized protein DUF4406